MTNPTIFAEFTTLNAEQITVAREFILSAPGIREAIRALPEGSRGHVLAAIARELGFGPMACSQIVLGENAMQRVLACR